MIGLIEDVRRAVQPGFKTNGDVIALLGKTEEGLRNSEFAVTVLNRTTDEIIESGFVPPLDLTRELAVQRACFEAAEAGLLRSAHDAADGGLGVALAESCFSTLGTEAIGAQVDLGHELNSAELLFSESASRILISFDPSHSNEIQQVAERCGCPFTILGHVGGKRLVITGQGREVVTEEVAVLEDAWRNALSRKLAAEAMAASME